METEKDRKLKQDKERKEKLKNVFIVNLLILLFIFFDKRQLESKDMLAKNPVFESGTVDWTGDKVLKREEASHDTLRIPGFKSMTLEADSHLVDVNLHNPASNKAYMLVRLVLSDTKEILYESKLIEPGKGLYKIYLRVPVDVGHHRAQLHYEPYDMETLTRLNGAVMNFDLIAKVYDE